MLVELGLVEQRYKAACEVLDGATVVDVARRNRVARQTVHDWLRAYAARGLAGLAETRSRSRARTRWLGRGGPYRGAAPGPSGRGPAYVYERNFRPRRA